jgi:23S rRNA pseudouridine1911/1915/1917 synthase
LKQTGHIISSDLESTDFEGGDEPSVDVELRTAVVGVELHSHRLDKALVDAVPEFSRSYLQQLVEAGAVRVNDLTVVKASQRVKAGDRISVELRATPQSQAFKAEAIPLVVVYEDADILVIDKPAGLVVHPAPGNWSGTLLNALLAYDSACSAIPRAGIVHRLDKDTSGLMVVAKSRLAMDALVRAIAAREVSRQYLAVAHGAWSGPVRVTVNAPIGRDPRNRLRMAIVDLLHNSGKVAQTDVNLLQNSTQACLVRCVLHTGRTHQIRVHMASLGHPLVADSVYGGKPMFSMERQALHAFQLAFDHPVSQVPMAFISQPSVDFCNLLDFLGLSYNGIAGTNHPGIEAR